MEKRNNIIIISLIVMVLLNIATLSSIWFGQQTDKEKEIRIEKFLPGDPPPPPGDKLAEIVGFRDDQIRKFEDLKREHHKNAGEIIEIIRLKKQELMKMVSSKPVNSDEVISVAYEIGKKQTELELLTFNHFKSIREICDEKQKSRFDNVITDLKDMIMLRQPIRPGN